MELAPLKFLTFEDIIRAGACYKGVIDACNEAGVYAGTLQDVLSKFPDSEERILIAARISGYGDGDGYGDGYGYGYGDGSGSGDGYG